MTFLGHCTLVLGAVALNGLPPPHKLVIVCKAVKARRHRANRRGEETVFQGAGWDLFNPVGNWMKVRTGIELRAERVLMREGTPQASQPAPGAAQVMWVVVQTGAHWLEIPSVGLSPPPAALQRVVLDVDDRSCCSGFPPTTPVPLHLAVRPHCSLWEIAGPPGLERPLWRSSPLGCTWS